MSSRQKVGAEELRGKIRLNEEDSMTLSKLEFSKFLVAHLETSCLGQD